MDNQQVKLVILGILLSLLVYLSFDNKSPDIIKSPLEPLKEKLCVEQDQLNSSELFSEMEQKYLTHNVTSRDHLNSDALSELDALNVEKLDSSFEILQNLIDMIDDLNQLREKYQTADTQYQKELTEYKKCKDDFSASKAQQQNSKKDVNYTQTKEKLDQVNKQIKKYQKNIREYSDMLTQFKNQIANLENTIKQQQQEEQKIQRNIQDYSSRQKSLDSDMNQAGLELKGLDQSFASLNEFNISQQMKLLEAETQLAMQEKLIEAENLTTFSQQLQSQKKKMQSNFLEDEKFKMDIDKIIQKAEELMNQDVQDISYYQNQIATMYQIQTTILSQMHPQKKFNQEIEASKSKTYLEELQLKQQQIKFQIQKIKEQLTQITEQHNQLTANHAKLQAKQKQIEQQNQELKTKLAQSQAQLLEIQANITEQNKDLTLQSTKKGKAEKYTLEEQQKVSKSQKLAQTLTDQIKLMQPEISSNDNYKVLCDKINQCKGLLSKLSSTTILLQESYKQMQSQAKKINEQKQKLKSSTLEH